MNLTYCHVSSDFVCQGKAGKIAIHQLDEYWSAEWVWPAKSGIKDYHDNMDGVGFEWWLENRLFSAF